MPKLQNGLYQVYEFVEFAKFRLPQALEYVRFLMRCNLFLCCAMLVVACGQHHSSTEQIEKTESIRSPSVGRILSRGLLGEPRTLDPQLADDTYSFQVIRDLYEGLTAEDKNGGIVAGIAESWVVNPSGDIYTFQLRRNARWSNGDLTTAMDFVEGLRRAVDPKTASGSAALLSVIRDADAVMAGRKEPSDLGVSATGEFQVQIELEHPAPYVLELLSQPIAFPVHRSRGLPTDAQVPAKKLLTTNGPYVLLSREIGSVIELTKNRKYWDESSVAVDRVRYLIAESEATEEREYAAGQLDITFTIPAPNLTRALKQYGTQVQSAPILATLFLALDLSEPPMRRNRELRQALSMTVDRELIADRVVTGVSPAYTYVAPGVQGYQSPAYPWVKWDRQSRLAHARKLFAQAGYSATHPLRLKLYFNRDEGIQRLMLAIADNWKEALGVESELVSDEFRVFLDGRKDKSRWDVARLGWTADYNDPSSFLDVFAQGNSQNDSGYSSSQFTELMAQAALEPVPVQRSALLSQAEKTLLEDYPIIPVYFYNARRLVKPYVGGATITPMNRTYSRFLFFKKTD